MTAGSSHDDGYGTRRPRRPPPQTEPSPEPTAPNLEYDPMLPPLELELEATAAPRSYDLPPTLAPETPLPRCLTEAVYASSRPAPGASQIPPAPKLPRFSMPAAKAAAPSQAATPFTEEAAPISESCLGLPTDRVLPGSPALVSTFRPKPPLRSCYSVTHTCQEERVYAPKRTRKAKPPAKHRR